MPQGFSGGGKPTMVSGQVVFPKRLAAGLVAYCRPPWKAVPPGGPRKALHAVRRRAPWIGTPPPVPGPPATVVSVGTRALAALVVSPRLPVSVVRSTVTRLPRPGPGSVAGKVLPPTVRVGKQERTEGRWLITAVPRQRQNVAGKLMTPTVVWTRYERLRLQTSVFRQTHPPISRATIAPPLGPSGSAVGIWVLEQLQVTGMVLEELQATGRLDEQISGSVGMEEEV